MSLQRWVESACSHPLRGKAVDVDVGGQIAAWIVHIRCDMVIRLGMETKRKNVSHKKTAAEEDSRTIVAEAKWCRRVSRAKGAKLCNDVRASQMLLGEYGQETFRTKGTGGVIFGVGQGVHGSRPAIMAAGERRR